MVLHGRDDVSSACADTGDPRRAAASPASFFYAGIEGEAVDVAGG